MAVAFKAAGALVSTTTTTLSIDQPALDVGDVVVGYFLGTNSGSISGSGYSTIGVVDLSGAYLIAVWKYASVAEAAGSVSVTSPSGSNSGRVAAYSGAGNTAPSLSSRVNASSSWADLPVPASPGFYVSGGIIWAARAFSTFINNGSITATSGSAAYDTVSGFRLFQAYSDVTAAGGGNVQVDFSGSNINSNTAMMQLVEAPAGNVYQVSGTVPVVATAAGGATRVPANSLSGSVNVVATTSGSALMRGQVSGVVPNNVTVVGAATNPNAPTAKYGPTGTNEFTLGTAAQTHQVDATWTAIATQITACAGHAGLCRIEVAPGTLPGGSGFASGSSGVLQNIGSATKNILITPRDGYGTVTVGATGMSFVGLTGIYIDRIDFSGTEGVMIRNSVNCGIGHTKINRLLSTGNGGDGVSGIKFVEMIAGPVMQIDVGYDRSEFKTASGYTMNDVSFVGCYIAPHWKPDGSSAHNDSIQIEAVNGGGALSNFHFDKTVLFRSADQGIQSAGTAGGVWRDSAFFGWEVTQIRYPLYPGGDPPTLDNTLNGTWSGIDAERIVVGGSIASGYTFTNSADNRVSTATSRPGWTQDTSLSSITAAQLEEMAPYPTDARLAQIWASAPPATTYPASGSVPVVSTAYANPYKGTAAAGVVPVVTVITGSAVKTTAVSGIVPVVSIATASPYKLSAVAGAIPVVSTVTGFAAGSGTLSGAIAVIAGASGTVVSRRQAAGLAPVVSAIAGNIASAGGVSGSVPVLSTAVGGAVGALNASGQPVPVVSTVAGSPVGSYPIYTWYEIRRNQVPNPSFESGVNNWSNYGSGIARTVDASRALFGSQSVRISHTGTGTMGTVTSGANRVPVVGGESVVFSYYASLNQDSRLSIQIGYYDETGAVVGSSSAPNLIVTADTWNRQSVSGTAPATAASVELRAFVGSGFAPADLVMWVDGVLFERGTTEVRDYFDGVPALTADGYRKYWAGAANASASIMEALDTRVSAVSTVSGSPIVTGGVSGSPITVLAGVSGDATGALLTAGSIAAISDSAGTASVSYTMQAPWVEDFSSGVSPFAAGPTNFDSVAGGILVHDPSALAHRMRYSTSADYDRLSTFAARVMVAEGSIRLAGISMSSPLDNTITGSYNLLLDTRNGSTSTAGIQIRRGSSTADLASVSPSEPIMPNVWYRLSMWTDASGTIWGDVRTDDGKLIGSLSYLPTVAVPDRVRPGVYNYGAGSLDDYSVTPTPYAAVVAGQFGDATLVISASGSIPITSTVTGTVGNSQTAGTVAVVTTVFGALTSRRTAGGVVPVVSVSTAAPTKRTRPTGTVPVVTTINSATLAARFAVAGAVPVVTTTSGSVSPTGSLEGSVNVVSTASGALSGTLAAAGTVAVLAGASGTVTNSSQAAGNVPVITDASGSIMSGIKVGGAAAVVAGASGTVTKATIASGTVPVITVVSGDPRKATSIDGAVAVTTDTFGYVAYQGAALGSVPVVSLSAGSTTTTRTASGTSIVTSAVGGYVMQYLTLNGVTSVITTASGSVVNAGLPAIPDILELEGSSAILWLRGQQAALTLKGR